MMYRVRAFSVVLVACVLFVGCAQKVTRVEADAVIDLSGRWNDTDSRLVAEEMSLDVVSRPWLIRFERANDRPPVVMPFAIKNRTSEHINTQTFIKNLERALINSGYVRVVSAADIRSDIRAERADQQEGFIENPVALGKELGADFALTGEINSITDRDGNDRLIYYQTNLELISIETNEKVWIGEKQIKKTIERSSYTF